MASLKTNKQDSPQIISLTRSRKNRSRWAKSSGVHKLSHQCAWTSWEGDNQNNSKRDLNVSSKQSLLNLPNFVIYRVNQRLTMYTYRVMPNFSKYFFKSNKCENVIKNFSNNRDTKQRLHMKETVTAMTIQKDLTYYYFLSFPRAFYSLLCCSLGLHAAL